MTFKSIVNGYVVNDSRKWVKTLLEENNIYYDYIDDKDAKFVNNDKFGMTYEVEITVSRRHGWEKTVLVVGGAVDQYGIYHSVIYKNGKVIWMSVEEHRNALNIEKFEI